MVKKIFILLITMVALVAIGALVLNVLLPNVATQMVNSVEGMIYNATSMSFDFNGDSVKGDSASGVDYSTSGGVVQDDDITDDANSGAIEGFK